MKRGLVCFLLLMVSAQVSAENGKHFWFLNGGAVWNSSIRDPDFLTMLSLTYGYGFTPHLSLEIDFLKSMSGGAYESLGSTGQSVDEKGEYKFWSLSPSLAYRHLFLEQFYFKGEVGYLYNNAEFTREIKTTESIEKNNHYVTGGLGLGYLAGAVIGTSLTVEIMASQYTSDNRGVTAGINVTF